MERICFIYKIQNKITGKCYVGSTLDKKSRWLDHKKRLIGNNHHSLKLQRAWNKYGLDNFSFDGIAECFESQRSIKEAFWMAQLDSVVNGYNVLNIDLDSGVSKIPEGSRNGPKNPFYGKVHSEETKKRMSISASKRKTDLETRKKISESNRGKSRPSISQALIGHQVSEETKQKLSKANKGRVFSSEVKERMREGCKNRVRSPHSEETKAKMRKPHKKKIKEITCLLQ
jgi:hypothetical protein